MNPFNLYYYFFNTNTNLKFPNKKIFVVSVLKTGFYWSKKYITYDEKNNINNNKSLGKAILNNHTIYIDKNGFGWIIPKKGKKCISFFKSKN